MERYAESVWCESETKTERRSYNNNTWRLLRINSSGPQAGQGCSGGVSSSMQQQVYCSVRVHCLVLLHSRYTVHGNCFPPLPVSFSLVFNIIFSPSAMLRICPRPLFHAPPARHDTLTHTSSSHINPQAHAHTHLSDHAILL